MKLIKAFKSIEEDEFAPLLLLFLHSFLNGIALIFFETTANTLFLMEYNVATLPYVYISTAIISVISGYFYTKLENNLNITKLLQITMLFVMSVMVFFLLLIKFTDSKLAYMGIMVSKDLVWMFIGMEFGILAGMIFNIRQGKRLFGVLMSGEILAGVLGGLSISVILKYIDTVNLLFISVITLIFSFILLNYILKKYSYRFKEEVQEDFEDTSLTYKAIFKNKYYTLFFVISVLSFFIFYFIDYLFYYYVESKFTNEKELASFFGVFYAVLNIVNLFSSLFISGLVLSRYGIIFGILVIPILAIIGASSLMVAAMLSLGVAFVILIVVKLFNEVFDVSILGPTFRVLYQSIPLRQRMKVIAFRETIIEPITMGLAGLALIGISMFESVELVYFSIFFISLVWIALGKKLKEQYILTLDKLLNQREVFVGELLSDDIDKNMFINGTKSSNDLEVIYCVDSLIKVEYKEIDAILKNLLSHESIQVRLSILDHIDKLDKDNLCEDISLRLDTEKNPEVLNRALKLYCRLGAVDSVEKTSQFIDSEDQVIKEGAIVGLLQFGGIDGVLVAGKVLNTLFASESKVDKMSALNILMHASIPSFYKVLKESLHSEDPEIKSVTIKVVGNLKVKALIPDLLINLESDKYRSITTQSLMKFGSKIFQELSIFFQETSYINSRLALIKVFSRMKNDEAHNFLVPYIKEPLLCDDILHALFNTNFFTRDTKLIQELILGEIQKILYYLDVYSTASREAFSNSYLVVNELIVQNTENVFFILGLRYPKEMILQAMINYKSDSKDTRAYTVEVIDNMLSKGTKNIILPILEDIAVEKKFSNYSYEASTSEDEFIHKVLEDENFPLILRLSFIYEIGKNKDINYLDNIKKLIDDENTDIKQTSIWTLSQLQKG